MLFMNYYTTPLYHISRLELNNNHPLEDHRPDRFVYFSDAFVYNAKMVARQQQTNEQAIEERGRQRTQRT
jgi:hypothetical protein